MGDFGYFFFKIWQSADFEFAAAAGWQLIGISSDRGPGLISIYSCSTDRRYRR